MADRGLDKVFYGLEEPALMFGEWCIFLPLLLTNSDWALIVMAWILTRAEFDGFFYKKSQIILIFNVHIMIISCDLSTSNDTKIPNMQSKILNEHLKWMPVNSLVKMDESIFFKVDSRGKILFNLVLGKLTSLL